MPSPGDSVPPAPAWMESRAFAGVVGAAEGEVELEPVEAGGERGGLAGYLVLNGAVVLALGEVEQLFKLADVAFEAAPL